MNQEEIIKNIKDKCDIKTTILKYPTAVDLRDWELYESIFSKDVSIDFSSFGGGPVADVKSSELLQHVLALMPGFDATQHQLTNFVIDVNDDFANVVAYMQAEHFIYIDNQQLSQTVGGYYTYKLRRESNDWKINSLKLTVTWARGEMKVYEIATNRVQNNK